MHHTAVQSNSSALHFERLQFRRWGWYCGDPASLMQCDSVRYIHMQLIGKMMRFVWWRQNISMYFIIKCKAFKYKSFRYGRWDLYCGDPASACSALVLQCNALWIAFKYNSFKYNSSRFGSWDWYCGDTMAQPLPSSFDWWKETH